MNQQSSRLCGVSVDFLACARARKDLRIDEQENEKSPVYYSTVGTSTVVRSADLVKSVVLLVSATSRGLHLNPTHIHNIDSFFLLLFWTSFS
jgi:hypothetical protein